MTMTLVHGIKKRDMKSNIHTLAIIPCLNEEATIASVILKAKKYVETVLVVDDGSIDNTVKIAREAGAVVISHDINLGKGAAVKTGFEYAVSKGYDYAVTIDGDGQHDPEEIPAVLGSILNNGHDISLGFRYGNSTEMPNWRRIGKRVLDYGTSLGNGGFVTDSQCGFRAFNKKAIQRLVPVLKGNAFSIESEQLIRAHDLDLKLVNTNISCKYEGLKNTSTKNPAAHGLSVLGSVIRLVVEKRPLLFIGVPGFVFILFGLILGIHTLQYYTQTHIFLVSYAMIISIFLIIGTISMLTGLVLNVLPNMIKQVET